MKDTQAWRSHKQGLDGSLMGFSAAEVLKRSGWSRSVGSANPYLALFARAGLRRAEVDAALAAVEIHELPSARGCTYVLPADDYALGLAVSQPFRGNEMKVAAKLGVTDEEIDRLRTVVAKAAKEAMEATQPEDFEGFEAPKKPQYALVGSLDNVLPPPGLNDVSKHRIVDRGRLVGHWDFDNATGMIVWEAFDKTDNAMKEAVKKTEVFIREDIHVAKMKGTLGC